MGGVCRATGNSLPASDWDSGTRELGIETPKDGGCETKSGREPHRRDRLVAPDA